MFSTFPDGAPGFGLLILRFALGTTLLFRGAIYLNEKAGFEALNWIGGFLALAFGTFLLVGLLTPVIGAIVFAGGILSVILSVSGNQIAPVTLEIYALVMAATIFLLGPGAFSLDARFFGRREVIIPKNPSSPNP